MNCTWDALDTVITMVCVAGRRGSIVFDSDLTLITDDKHTDAWLADSLTRGDRLTGSDSILIRLDHG